MVHTVRGRYILIVSLTVLLTFIILATVSLILSVETVESRGKAYLASGCDIICETMEQEYLNALQITQQMMPEGSVGAVLSELLTLSDPFEMANTENEFRKIINTITFMSSQPELYMYCNASDGSSYLSNMSVKKTFRVQNVPVMLKSTKTIEYHPIHQSQSYVSDYPVLSVSRRVTFPEDRDFWIYVEVRTNALNILNRLSENAQAQYGLLLLNTDNKVCYSSNIEYAPDMDTSHFLTDEYGYSKDGYVWYSGESQFGFRCVVLESYQDFFANAGRWLILVGIALIVVILILILSVYLFNTLILKKLNRVVEEIGNIREDSLTLSQARTGLSEYDLLLDRFSQLLERIQHLIMDLSAKEKERSKLELEKLYFQINPHFLLNSLHTVYWIARMRNQQEISSIVHALMEILSYTLGKSDKTPTFRSELAVVKAYVIVESHRHEFQVDYDIEDGDYLDLPAPRLIIQPLVENAISHGLNVGGKLYISVHNDNSTIRIQIIDDGCGMDPILMNDLNNHSNSIQNSGLGIQYVINMLTQFYGEHANIHFESRENGGTIVTMIINMEGKTENDPSTPS